MDERGFGYIGLLFSVCFITIFLLMAFTHFEQILMEERRIQGKWEMFWLAKNEIELWKESLPRGDADHFLVQVRETRLSTNIMEGEFTVRWTEENSLKTMTITAYKLVSH